MATPPTHIDRPCLPLSSQQVDDHVGVLQGPLDGVLVLGIPLLARGKHEGNIERQHVCVVGWLLVSSSNGT